MEYYHPLFLYEFFWNLINAGLLIYISKRFRSWLRRGDLFLMYLVIYSIGRFSLEFLRLDPSPLAMLNINQTLMAVVFVSSLVVLYLRHRFAGPQPLEAPVDATLAAQDPDTESTVSASSEH